MRRVTQRAIYAGPYFAVELDGATNTATAGARTIRTERFVKQEAAGDADGIAVRGAWTQAGPRGYCPPIHPTHFKPSCQ